jgi:hypothetical protein
MNAIKSGLCGLACTLALVVTGASADDKKGPVYSNKWRVEVSERAASDGTIQFRVTPKDGTPSDVSVTIANGRGENDVAKDIRDAMKNALDVKAFHVEVDDGEDVLVKKKSGPDFALELVQTTVMATRLDIEKE